VCHKFMFLGNTKRNQFLAVRKYSDVTAVLLLVNTPEDT
jgi:hypothetical protein